jgi:CRISPR/Cas system CMR-associated protein Cmr5 small subunit
MESTINEMLGFAITAITINKEIKNKGKENEKDKDKVEGIYESYLSQFGPMVVQMELPCTVAVYNSTKAKGGGSREQILNLLYTFIKDYDSTYLYNCTDYNNWAKHLMTEPLSDDCIDIILDASVALKRAIRTFPLTSKKDEE